MSELLPNEIFVFGSNTAGAHGGGAARDALCLYGAKLGQGIGLQGRSFAIPTMDGNLRTLPLNIVEFYVSQFLEFARNNPRLNFCVTRIGCGIAGYKDEQIAPLFADSPDNVRFFDTRWKEWKSGNGGSARSR